MGILDFFAKKDTAEKHYYELGTGYAKKKQYDKAIEAFTEGIKNGKPECAYALGELYEGGYAGSGKSSSALLYYEKGIAMNHAKSAYKAARILYFGEGVEENHELAEKYLRIGLRQDDPDCQCLMGTIYELGSRMTDPDYKLAFKYYKLAADKGVPIARFAIGKFYMDGAYGLEKNEKKAVQIFAKLAEENYPGAAARLAVFYCQNKNDSESLKWALKGAEINDANCLMLAGCFYEDGAAVKKDMDKAMDFYRKAALNGEPRAYISLGLLNYDHYHRYFSALEDFRHAAEAGIDGAMYYLNQTRTLLLNMDFDSQEEKNEMVRQVNRIDPRDKRGNLI